MANVYKGNTTPAYLGERILYLRKKKGIPRQEVLDKAGISNSTLSRIEDNAGSYVSSQTVANLAELFDVSCDYLINGKDHLPKGHPDISMEIFESPNLYEFYRSYDALTTDKKAKVIDYVELLKKN